MSGRVVVSSWVTDLSMPAQSGGLAIGLGNAMHESYCNAHLTEPASMPRTK
jgi:hypothetical protein